MELDSHTMKDPLNPSLFHLLPSYVQGNNVKAWFERVPHFQISDWTTAQLVNIVHLLTK